MALARQGTSTLRSIGEGNTTLLFDIHRTLGLCGLGLGLILLFLFLGLLVVFVGLALFALLGIVGALDSTLLGALLSFHCVVTHVTFVADIIVIFAVSYLGPVRSITSLLLLARLLLFRLQAAADVICGSLLENGALAVLANDCFNEILFARLAGRK